MKIAERLKAIQEISGTKVDENLKKKLGRRF